MKKRWRKIVSFALILTLIINLIPANSLFVKVDADTGDGIKPEGIESVLDKKLGVDIAEPDVAVADKDMAWLDAAFKTYRQDGGQVQGTVGADIIINTSVGMILLSQVDPLLYKNMDIHIAAGIDVTAPAVYEDVEYKFQGLGSVDKAHAYAGTLYFDTVGSGSTLTLNRALFNGVLDTVIINNSFTVIRNTDKISSALVADHVYSGAGETKANWSVETKTYTYLSDDISYNNESFSYAGIIGTLHEGAKVTVGLVSGSTPTVTSIGNAGIICGTMEEGSKLVISGLSTSGGKVYDVVSQNGSAGAVVGYMSGNSELSWNESANVVYKGDVAAKECAGGYVGYVGSGAQITMPSSYTVKEGSVLSKESAGGIIGLAKSGSSLSAGEIAVEVELVSAIETAAHSGNAGGLVGSSFGMEINASAQSFTLSPIVSAGNGAGGVYGYLDIASDTTIDTDAYDISTTISHGYYAGGLLGVVVNKGYKFYIKPLSGTPKTITVSLSADNIDGYFGGVVGMYESASPSADASLLATSVTLTRKDASTALTGIGGAVGLLDGYMSFDDVSVDVTAGASNSFGGIISTLGAKGWADVRDIAVKATYSKGTAGGVVGTAKSGSTLRLSGTTDLSNLTLADTNAKQGQLVGLRENAYIYALGTGNGAGVSGYDWTLIRPTVGPTTYASDIATYGEVVRLDGVKLTEGSGEYSATDVVKFDAASHTMTVYPVFGASGGSDATIKSLRDYVAASMLLNYNGTGANRNITLETDINLAGTGVITLNRDNGGHPYKGTFDGDNHTVSLAIGEKYGKDVTEETLGAGEIYYHTHFGLFGAVQSGKVKTVNIDSSVYNLYSLSNVVNAGGVCGVASGTGVSFDNITASNDININITTTPADIKVGGLVGELGSGINISINDSKWNGKITNNAIANFYVAGFVGNVVLSDSNVINSDGCIVSGNITQNQPTADAYIAGFIANNYNTTVDAKTGGTINVSNLTIDELKLDAENASASVGGMLGHSWFATTTLENVVIKRSSLKAGAANFGGLLYNAKGYMKIGNNGNVGVKYAMDTAVNSFTSTNATDTSALLVAYGNMGVASSKNDTTKALYLEVMPGAYEIEASACAVSVKAPYFDELVGYSANASGLYNGVVSIGLEEASAGHLDEAGCNSYKNRLTDTPQNNPNTRYYYDIEKIKKPGVAISTIDSPENLMLWSLYSYAGDNIKSFFAASVAGAITGEIDLTGYSYYPVSKKADISNAVITFNNKQFEDAEKAAANKKPSDDLRQHYMMHTGLFMDVVNKNGVDTFNAKNVELKGNIGTLKDNQGSGAIVVGTVSGGSGYLTTVNLTNITLSGLKVNGVSEETEYAPLIINKIGTYVTLNIDTMKTVKDGVCLYNEGAHTGLAATSLIGKVGSAEATNLTLSFSKVGLDARTVEGGKSDYGTYKSIFIHATFLDSFSYAGDSAASSGTYHFTKDEEGTAGSFDNLVTYGYEISNSTSGRNPGQQYWYFDSTMETKDPLDTSGAASSERFKNGYLRYVYNGNASENKEAFRFEIDVNQQVFNMTEGCGTYGDPYIIKNAGQLIQLQNFVQSGSATGWQVTLNTAPKTGSDNSVFSKKIESTSNYHDNTLEKGSSWADATYTAVGSTWTINDTSLSAKTTVNSTDVRRYLLNAYYVIEPEVDEGFYGITLGNNFLGIGDNVVNTEATLQAFSGAFIGRYKAGYGYPTIKYEGEWSAEKFGGLVLVSNGSVVKDINLDYSDADITINCNDTHTMRLVANSDTRTTGQALSYFGGVYGFVIGGDNIIENVTITGLNSIKAAGLYPHLAAIGGYAGLVGGDAFEGGGVIFRNMPAVSLSVNGVNTATEVTDGNEKYYWNPYVGRVLDAFACYEYDEGYSTLIDNTNKNYKIPTLVKGDKLVVDDDKNITVSSAQQMWLLSAIVNSGAGAMTTSKAYDNNSYGYRYGKVRTARYNKVGIVGVSSSDSEITFALHDELLGGGNAGALQDKVSYLVRFHTVNSREDVDKTINSNDYRNASFITGGVNNGASNAVANARSYKVILDSSEIDLSSYGNGFRGIGAQYSYIDVGTSVANKVVFRKTLSLSGIEGNGVSVKLNMNKHEYYDELISGGGSKVARDKYNGISTRQQGLFNVGSFYANCEVKDINLTGNISINWAGMSDKGLPVSYMGIAGAQGGLFGALSRTVESKQILAFKNINMSEFTMKGSQFVGGLIGSSVVIKAANVADHEAKDANGDNYEGTYQGNINIDKCKYDNINLEGDYSVGGLIGCFKGYRLKTSYIHINGFGNDEKDFTDSTISCKFSTHAFDNGSFDSGNVPKSGFLLGCSATIGSFVSALEAHNLLYESILLLGQPIVDNSDYGIGMVFGTFTSKSKVDTLLEISDVKVNECKFIAADPEEISKSYYSNKCVFTIHCGGIYGYARALSMRFINLYVGHTEFVNGNYTGGIAGSLTNTEKEISFINCVSEYNKMYTLGNTIWSYVGTAPYGGIAGSMNLEGATTNTVAVFESLVSRGNVIVNEGSIGGLVGVIILNKTVKTGELPGPFQIRNCIIQDNKLVSYGKPEYQIQAKNEKAQTSTKLNSYINKANGKGATGQVGGVIGTFRNAKMELTGYNLLWKDNLIGYLLEDNNGTMQLGKYSPDMSLDATNVGLSDYNKSSNKYVYYSYKQATDGGMFTSDKSLVYGYAARWLGYAFGAKMKLVGVSCSGEYMPNSNGGQFIAKTYKDNEGNSVNCSEGEFMDPSSYIIYSDYDAVDPNVPGAANPDGLVKNYNNIDGEAGKSPYVTVNGYESIKLLDGAGNPTDTTVLTLTSDGVNPNVVNRIINNYKANSATHNNLVYGLAGKQIRCFIPGDSLYKYDETMFSTYRTAEEGQRQIAPVSDFPVLLIDSSMSASDVDTLLQTYISVLTNRDQTGSSAATMPMYKSISAVTYAWDYDNNEFVKKDRSSITVNNNHISVAYGQYDSGKSQFTLLDVAYANPSKDKADEIVYHLYIPIVVKKLLQYNFFASVKNGTDYYDGYYVDKTGNTLVLTEQVLGSYGEPLTVYMRYNYLRSKFEWEAAVNSGENCLVPYDKVVDIGTNLPAGTWLGLIDVNSGTANYADVSILNGGHLTFSDMGWNGGTYLGDMLDLVAEESDSGLLVACAENDDNKTIRVKDGSGYKYFKPYIPEDYEEGEAPTRYALSVGDKFKEYESSRTLPLEEEYYLTIVTPDELPGGFSEDTIVQNRVNAVSVVATLGSPTQRRQGIWEISSSMVDKYIAASTYNLGRFFKQSFTLSEYSEELMAANEKDGVYEIEFALDTTVSLQNTSEAYRKRFDNISTNSSVYHGYLLRLNEYNSDEKTSTAFPIPAGSLITIYYTVERDGNTLITTEDKPLAYSVTQSGDYLINTGEVLKDSGLLSSSSVKELVKLGAEIKAHVTLTLTAEEVARFPQRLQSDTNNTSGIVVSATSFIGFDEDNLLRSSLNTSARGSNHYYQYGTSSAVLYYYAGEYDSGDGTGDVSQLGINGLEDEEAMPIVSFGVYNVSALIDTDKATTVRLKLELFRKTDAGSYVKLDANLDDYMKEVRLVDANGSDVSMNSNGGYFIKDVAWTDLVDAGSLIEGMPNKDVPIVVPFKYMITTNWNDGEHTYANYRVRLTAELGYYLNNKWVTISNSVKNDEICYTNTKIMTNILAKP